MGRIGLATLIAAILVGCSPSQPPVSTPSIAPLAPVPLPTEAASAVNAALAAAADHLRVAPSQLHVDQVQAQQWPDSSLGCPQPGQLYSQIVTPGYLVLVSAGSTQLEYHTDTRSNVTLCHES